LVGGNKKQASAGVDGAADVAKDKVPDQHDENLDQAADRVKDPWIADLRSMSYRSSSVR